MTKDTIKGIDGFIDELSDLGQSPLTPHGRDCVRTILLAFAAHVRHQDAAPTEPQPPAGEAPHDITYECGCTLDYCPTHRPEYLPARAAFASGEAEPQRTDELPHNTCVGRAFGRLRLRPDSVAEICWVEKHGAVKFWQILNRLDVGSLGIVKGPNDTERDAIDQMDAGEAEPTYRALKAEAGHWKAETERLRIEVAALTDENAALKALIAEFLAEDDDARSEAFYCWWCKQDVNGTNGPVESHDPNCLGERARAVIVAAQLTKPASGTAETFDFRKHLQRQREWSERTFGPGMRTAGIIDHITKELREIEADTADLKEWIDVVILGLDGAWRAGHSPDAIIAALAAKQAKNEARIWPDWRTQPLDKAIEHERDKPNSGTSETIQLARREPKEPDSK